MVEVAGRPGEMSEGPETMDHHNVQFWCKHAKELEKSQTHKAKKFIEYECLKYVGKDEEFGSRYCFVCLPLNTESEWPVPLKPSEILAIDEQYRFDAGDNCVIYPKKPYPKDYNSSEYKIYKNQEGRFECNCQGWQHKERRGEGRADGCNCSHVLALMFWFKIRAHNSRRSKSA